MQAESLCGSHTCLAHDLSQRHLTLGPQGDLVLKAMAAFF